MTGDYRWVESFDDLIRAIVCTFAQTGRPVEVACRVDTGDGAGADGSAVGAAIGFTMAAGAADCLDLAGALPDDAVGELRHLLTSPRIRLRGANFKSEMVWLAARLDIACSNFAFDALLAGSLLDENRANSLAAYARLYAALDTDTEDGDDARQKLLRRLGRAVDAAFQAAVAIRGELLASPALAHFYVNLLHPASQAFARLEQRGVVASRARFEALRVELEGEDGRGGALADLDRQVLALLPGRLRMKYADNLAVRPAMLRDFFFGTAGLHLKPRMVTPRHGEPSTAKAHLAMFHDVPEAAAMVTLLEARSSAAKMLSAYVKGFLKHLRADGRFHPAYMLFAGRADDGDESGGGTVTGRTSARDPAIQTVPKRGTWAKKLRRCFVAPPGMAIWSADAAQGELKIAACLAGEANMLAAYRGGLDLHAVTGASMMDMPTDAFMALAADVTDREKMERFELGRFKAKACNFGLLYGMQAKGFVRYAWQTFKMVLTEAQAQEMIDRFFATYPGLLDWHEAARKQARRDGAVANPFGRVRHLPWIRAQDRQIASRAERQAINAPVQSTLSDLTCWALSEIDRQIPDAHPCAMIHDAIVGYCPEDRADEIGRQIVEVASTLPIETLCGWRPQLAFTFDHEHGPDMGSMTKMKA